jgi:hypothetical protein
MFRPNRCTFREEARYASKKGLGGPQSSEKKSLLLLLGFEARFLGSRNRSSRCSDWPSRNQSSRCGDWPSRNHSSRCGDWPSRNQSSRCSDWPTLTCDSGIFFHHMVRIYVIKYEQIILRQQNSCGHCEHTRNDKEKMTPMKKETLYALRFYRL